MITSVLSRDRVGYEHALCVAELSTCRYKLGSVILGKGNRPLSVAVNVIKSHPDHVHWPSHVVSVHAEHASIIRAKRDLTGSTIYVARSGGNANSKPCPYCYECIRLAGIKYIVYQENNELFKVRVA